MDAVIKAENLGKKYIIGHQKQRYGDSLRDAMTHTARGIWQRIRHPLSPNRESVDLEELWALKDIDFEVQQGERVGIIGANGAGKSTLLKVLSRITEPTTGKVRIKGRVSSLLEVGTGFHPELTGRENVFLNGAILGMARQEIKKKFDEIVAFAELEKFLDTPVKRYSSGMYVRLAFAVAAHLEPEILIVDEVLAVGDAAFQKKCLGKMENVAKEGRTVLFVSHNMAAIQGLCQRAIVLEAGSFIFDGTAEQGVRSYLSSVTDFSKTVPINDRIDRTGSGKLRFTGLHFRTGAGKRSAILSGDPLYIELEYKAEEPLHNVSISVPFYSITGQSVFMAWTRLLGSDFLTLPPQGKVVVEIPRLPLREGSYAINLWCEVNGILADWVKEAATFFVSDGDFFGTGNTPPAQHGLVVVDHRFYYEPV